jgi:C4-dicarboxylate transporter DctM subunit
LAFRPKTGEVIWYYQFTPHDMYDYDASWVLLATVTWFYAWRNDFPRMKRASWGERFRAFRDSAWGLLLIGIVLGGIYSGKFTPTEAAAMAAVYSFFIAVFVYKDLPLKRVPKVLLDAANLSAMLLYIITNAVLFSFLMTNENIPQALATWMISKQFSPWVFLLVVNLLLLAAGNVMEPSSILLIMAPILFPIITKLGIDPLHFDILTAVNMEVGLCHPPVGLNLYVASGIAKMGITELTVAVLPWLITITMLFLPRPCDLLAGTVAVAPPAPGNQEASASAAASSHCRKRLIRDSTL